MQQAARLFGGAVALVPGGVTVRDPRPAQESRHRSARPAGRLRRGGASGRRRAGCSGSWARSPGARPASINELYLARGRGDVRRLHRARHQRPHAGLRHGAGRLPGGAGRARPAPSSSRSRGARSPIPPSGPTEYVAVLIGAALREGYTLPLFIQGDHCQVNAKKYAGDPEGEVGEVKKLIAEEVAAGFYNIDVDTSTLVDLSRPTPRGAAARQLRARAEITAFIREQEPEGVTVSVGGGDRRGGPQEQHGGGAARLHARLHAPRWTGCGVTRGAEQDLGADRHLARRRGAARRHHRGGQARPRGAGGAFQGGAPDVRHGGGGAARRQHAARATPSATFPRIETCEIHLATNFQNIVFDHPKLPAELRKRDVRLAGRERRRASARTATPRSSSTTRRGRRPSGRSRTSAGRWPQDVRDAIAADLERTFRFLFEQLNVNGTETLIDRFIHAPVQHHASLEKVLVAAEDDPDAGDRVAWHGKRMTRSSTSREGGGVGRQVVPGGVLLGARARAALRAAERRGHAPGAPAASSRPARPRGETAGRTRRSASTRAGSGCGTRLTEQGRDEDRVDDVRERAADARGRRARGGALRARGARAPAGRVAGAAGPRPPADDEEPLV